ncbi:MAG: peptidase M61 [Novosphingobium sp.]
MRTILTAATALLALSAAGMTSAQPAPRSAPVAVPIARTVPDAADVPYPGGPITLEVDASDTRRAAFRVTETIPVAPGTERLTLLFPQWLPGNHSPRGNLAELTNLTFTAGGKTATWARDPVEVYAFHVDVPAGAREVVAKFVYTSPLQSSEGRIVMTQEMLNLQWEQVSLYPAGHYVRQIRIKPAVTFPAGWGVATALDRPSGNGGGSGSRVTWAETDYETLIDSPIFAGANFRKWDLGSGVMLNVVADKPEQLDAKPEQIAAHRALVAEALATFGARHFDRYEFLLALTDRMGGIGLEHHRSSENQLEPNAFVKWADYDWDRGLLPHEFAHSWNGKFRRPARMWTPDYRTPMQDNLLWVYEGQTQFWGLIHAARSGLQSKEIVLGQLANYAGLFSQQPGREWRSVEDTTHDPIFAARKAKPFPSLARNEDYYTEGALVWLEADQIIRAGTGDRKGLDDFARGFFGMRDGDWGEVGYEFGDVVAALNAVYPYDWAKFLQTRLQTPGQPAPLGGIECGGYRLAWRDEPNPFDKARMAEGKFLSLYNSLGLVIDKDAKVTAARWDSAALNAGVVPGAKVVAVNGSAYDQDGLKAAITAAKTGPNAGRPLELLIQRGDKFQTLSIPYRDGLRWPWLERAPGKSPAGLDALLAPRRPNAE